LDSALIVGSDFDSTVTSGNDVTVALGSGVARSAFATSATSSTSAATASTAAAVTATEGSSLAVLGALTTGAGASLTGLLSDFTALGVDSGGSALTALAALAAATSGTSAGAVVVAATSLAAALTLATALSLGSAGHSEALVNQALSDGLLEANTLILGLVLGKSDGEERHGSLESEGVEAFLKGLEDIFEHLSADVVDLVETLHSVLDDLSH
jgi:hypothetical protein